MYVYRYWGAYDQQGNEFIGVPEAVDEILRRPFGRRGRLEEQCDGREAELLATIPVAGGSLQFLGFDKYGRWNVHMRWVAKSAAEAEAPQGAPAADTTLLSEIPRDLTGLFGGGARIRR